MNIKELVGKRAVRSIGAKTSYGVDNSYTTEPIRVLKVTDTHIVFNYCGKYPISKDWNTKKRLLTHEWIDDNWVDYDKLICLGEQEENEQN